MGSALRAARSSGAALAGLAVILAASGWLYIIQPSRPVPGPPVTDALPLDELSRRSAVPLLVFVAVWICAGLLLGILTRVARVERLTAALLLALGVGAWSYLVTGVSLLVVRQIPAEQAFASAAWLRAVYVPAALAGVGGALFGRVGTSARPRAPFVLAWFTAAAGLLGILDAVLPTHRDSLLADLAPATRPIAHALVAPLGLALVICARGLARERRRAWQAAFLLLAGTTLLHFLHGFDYGAIATGLIALALVARRHDFAGPGDPSVRPRVVLRGLGSAGAILGYGFVALWLNRLEADQPFTARFALRETGAALVGLTVRGSGHLAGDFGQWFPPSILVLGVTGVGWLLLGWLAPWRYRLRQQARDRELVRALVATWGVDTLAPFVLRADKSYFFAAGERAFLAYKVVGNVAIMSGDPIGPPDAVGPLLDEWLAHARACDWRVAVLGASERHLGLYRERGLHALYHGDEAIVETSSFSLEGRAIRKVRQSAHRLERAGYHVDVLRPSDIDHDLRHELEAVARSWRGAAPERGFVMALDTLFALDDDHAVFVIGRDERGAPVGFLHFAVSRVGSALSLSSMPRLRSTPNGFNEWLVSAAIEWAREAGFARVSLNFAPFAALLAPAAELSSLQRVERRALLALKGHFQLDNLLNFNRKFFPCWERRFVVYERRRDLPRVGIAALAAEAYLPGTGRSDP